MSVLAAVDLGASGGRVMRAEVEDDRVELEAVHRFPNRVVDLDGHLRWRISELATEVRAGLAMIPEAEFIGIDTWAVDYRLLDDDGRLLAEPVSYRDDRTAVVIDRVHSIVSPEDLYASTASSSFRSTRSTSSPPNRRWSGHVMPSSFPTCSPSG